LRPYISRLCELLQPSQHGIGTPRGCEAAVHATRSFIAQTQGEKVLLKLNVENAFNSIRRDKVLQAAQTHLPEIYPFIWDCYCSKTSLFHGDFRLDSATGVQQGDPLSPALLVLIIHGVASEVKSDLNVWYLDDGCIGGDPQTVLSNADITRNGLSSVGLEINNSKCELLIVNNTTSQGRSETIKFFQEEFPSISIPAPNLWQLLGSPLLQVSTPLHLEQWFPTIFMPWPTCRFQQNVVAHHHRTTENATLSSFTHKYEQTKYVLYHNTSNYNQY